MQRNALGPELRCCLQDCRVFASGRGTSAVVGSVQRRQELFRGIASSSRDCGRAISADCPGTLRGIRDRSRAYSGDSRRGAFAGIRLRRRRPDGFETSRAGKPFDSSDNAVHPYGRCRFTLPVATSHPGQVSGDGQCRKGALPGDTAPFQPTKQLRLLTRVQRQFEVKNRLAPQAESNREPFG